MQRGRKQNASMDRGKASTNRGKASTSRGNVLKPINRNNLDEAQNNSPSSLMDFFRDQQSTQRVHNMSFSSQMSFGSEKNATMIELPHMISVLEARRKSLEERRNEITKINDDQIKKILLDMVDDMKNVVEDGDKILQCHNELISRQIEDSDEIQFNSKSINNLTKGIGNLSDGIHEMKNRVQSLEVSKNCIFDSQFINIVFVDARDADCVENGVIGPKQKFTEILSNMKIIPPKDVMDAYLMNVRRFVSGKRKQIRMLRTRFADSLTAGRIFSQIIKHNKSLTEAGKNDEIKYYAEMPASKNVWKLKRICYELKDEGIFTNVRGSERGILVYYKIKNQDNGKDEVKSTVVTSEKEINDLRILLKADDAYISVADKYNDEYFNNKRNPENKQKRSRECDDNEDCISPKRVLTTTKATTASQ